MAVEDKLKIAIIGLGRMGAEPTSRLGEIPNGYTPVSHAESIKSIEQLELVALCDIDLSKVEKFSRIYDVPHGFEDYKKLVDIIKPDVISIATRTNLKEEIINYAVEHGVLGIYVEKPLATSLSQCERILNHVNKFGTKLTYGTQRRGMPVFRKAKERAHSGELGNIKSINFEHGNNLLFWSLPHITDLITFLTNSSKFNSISALCQIPTHYSKESTLIDADPVVESAIVKMENGITAYITPGAGSNIRIFLEKGIITINSDWYSIDTSIEARFKAKFTELSREFTEPSKSGTQELFSDLTESVLNCKPLSRVTNHEILGGTEILFGIVESGLRNGTIIRHEDLRKNLEITGRFGDLYA